MAALPPADIGRIKATLTWPAPIAAAGWAGAVGREAKKSGVEQPARCLRGRAGDDGLKEIVELMLPLR
jgi:hypothetical protein